MVVGYEVDTAKMSERVERAYLMLETVQREMSVKGMEGIKYHRELSCLLKVNPALIKLKQALRERGQ